MILKSVCLRQALAVWVLVGALGALAGCEPSSIETTTPDLRIGLITNNPNGLRNVHGFRAGMAALGYVEGESVAYVDAGKPVAKGRLRLAITEMIEAEVDLIFTAGTPTGIAAYEATASHAIPVVFGVIANPLAAGVMTDLTHPGRNMTGVMLSQNQGRRLEIFLEMLPGIQRILVPYNPGDAAASSSVAQIEAAASALGCDLLVYKARDDAAVSALLAAPPEKFDAIFLVPDSVVNRRLTDIIRLAEHRKLPVSGPSTAQVEEGALMTYGFVHDEVGRQAARIADQILRGADPGVLPVETAEFYLSINLAAAKAIGVPISDDFLQRAKLIFR